jgi:murein DD-endopeptidase MepM/ murein hydrolase activator NlpD
MKNSEFTIQNSQHDRRLSVTVLHLALRLAILSLFTTACAAEPLPTLAPTPGPISITVAPTLPVQLPTADANLPPEGRPISNTATPYPTTDFLAESTSSIANIKTTEPLRFNFGTQTPAPTLNWRPPPYPVPVSIRPEDHFWFARPIASNAVNWPHPLYRYGSTYFGNMHAHTGVDLDSPLGTPVLAAGSGVVVWTGYGLFGTNPPEDDPYGLAIAIKHDFGYDNQTLYTIYAHMSKINVWLNQPVAMGEQIGEVGTTGFSSGPHLHFEVRIGDNKFLKTYNPELWLAPPTSWGVLAGRALDKNGNYVSELPIDIYDSAGRYYLLSTYATRSVNADPAYKENFVISDLPAGTYRYSMNINGEAIVGTVEILAGQTAFIIVQETVKEIAAFANPAATNGKAPTLSPTPTSTRAPTTTPTPTPKP